MKRIVFSEQAKADVRAIPQPIAMNFLTAIHRLTETGAGRVKTFKGTKSEKRLLVGDYRVRFSEEGGATKRARRARARFTFAPCTIARKLNAEFSPACRADQV